MITSLPPIQLRAVAECCKLPQRVRAEPGHQMHFGEMHLVMMHLAFQGADFLYFKHRTYCTTAIDLFYDSNPITTQSIMLTKIVHRTRDCVGIIAGFQHIDGPLEVKYRYWRGGSTL